MSKSYAIDMHCDTLMKAYLNSGDTADIYDMPDANIDLKRLVSGGAMAQFLAIFIVPQALYTSYLHREPIPDEVYIAGCKKVFENTLERHPDLVSRACNASDIEQNSKDGKVSAVLTMEDGVAVQGDMANLDRYYDMGVRALSLTWNFENCFGFPNSKDPEIMAKGLKPFGIEAIKHMQDIGMLVDVSHLSDGGFWDVAKYCTKPFVATHSNCRALSPHTRNMTDDMIKALYKAGGVMGINFGPEFLNVSPENRNSTIERMVAMAQHEKEIAGVEVIALGTDFDGIEGNLEVDGPDKMHLLCDALVKNGFSLEDVDKITHGNILRVMKEAVK